jgi:hypothetical protein
MVNVIFVISVLQFGVVTRGVRQLRGTHSESRMFGKIVLLSHGVRQLRGTHSESCACLEII